MTKKLHEAEQKQELHLTAAMRNSAQQIWQAGLGAFAAAREEGSDLFARLMQEGVSLQMRTQQLAGQKVSDMIARMSETIGRQAAGPLGKMEEVFEERFTQTLRNFGVPTQDDLKALTDEIEVLRKTVTSLSNAGARVKKSAAKGKEKGPAKTGARKAISGSRTTTLKRQAKVAVESRA